MSNQENLNLARVVEIILSANQQPNKPLLIGLTGASGAGKTTLNFALQKAFQAQYPNWQVSVIQADNFIYSNDYLIKHNLMQRKGFPESFDAKAFQACLENLRKNSNLPIPTPCYSQDIKDIIPNKTVFIERSHVYLIEGVNIFFKYENFCAINYLDFCIYLDTDPFLVKERALARFFDAYEQSKKKPTPYFEQFKGWTDAAIREHAEKLWLQNDQQLLKTYIEPYRAMANLILKSYN